MATVARPSLRSGLRLHFCSRPFICSAPLHAVHLFSVLSLSQGPNYMRKKNVAALLVIPSVPRDLTSDERFATPGKVGRFLASLGMTTESHEKKNRCR